MSHGTRRDQSRLIGPPTLTRTSKARQPGGMVRHGVVLALLLTAVNAGCVAPTEELGLGVGIDANFEARDAGDDGDDSSIAPRDGGADLDGAVGRDAAPRDVATTPMERMACGLPLPPVQSNPTFPDLAELNMELRPGLGATFRGRLVEPGTLFRIWLELVDESGRVVKAEASVEPDEFELFVGVDACTQSGVRRLQGVILRDSNQLETMFRDLDGDGVFEVIQDGAPRGQRDLGRWILNSPTASSAHPILTSITLAPLDAGEGVGFAANVTLSGGEGCGAASVVSFARAVSNYPCQPVLQGVSSLVGGRARPATMMRRCMGGGTWTIEGLALRPNSHPWDLVPIEDPSGLLPISIDLGGPAPFSGVPQVEGLTFSKESRSDGTVITVVGDSNFRCPASGSITFNPLEPNALPVTGIASLGGGDFSACLFIPKKWSPNRFELSQIRVRPEYGCDLNLAARGGVLQDLSQPGSGSELPTALPVITTP